MHTYMSRAFQHYQECKRGGEGKGHRVLGDFKMTRQYKTKQSNYLPQQTGQPLLIKAGGSRLVGNIRHWQPHVLILPSTVQCGIMGGRITEREHTTKLTLRPKYYRLSQCTIEKQPLMNLIVPTKLESLIENCAGGRTCAWTVLVSGI